MEWLAPPASGNVLEESQKVRQEGTAEWILEDVKFLNWKKTPPLPAPDLLKQKKMPRWFLWVNGESDQ